MATIQMTTRDFKDKVFNYETEQDWKYQGVLPAIIDFYADWCGPCKMVAPVLEELSEEYEDRIIIYKVDTDAEQELSSVFGIRSIPTMLIYRCRWRTDDAAGSLSQTYTPAGDRRKITGFC